MRTLAATLVLGTALVVAPLAHAQGKTDPTFTKMAAAFEAAYNAKDAAKVAAMYAEDAVAMPPNAPMVKGRPAIEARLKKDMSEAKYTLKITPVESASTGNTGYEVGTVTITLEGGKAMTEKYLVIFKRMGSEWKIAYDIWNSDAPPETPK